MFSSSETRNKMLDLLMIPRDKSLPQSAVIGAKLVVEFSVQSVIQKNDLSLSLSPFPDQEIAFEGEDDLDHISTRKTTRCNAMTKRKEEKEKDGNQDEDRNERNQT